MFDYYHYFVEKGNHPSKEDILSLESDLRFSKMDQEIADEIIQRMKEHAKQYEKPIGGRIIYQNQVLGEFLIGDLGEDSLNWLTRKEKVCNEVKHSSYYAFLDSIYHGGYEHMINDESYGLCGGSFPIIIDGNMEGTITATGLRPNEDHEVVIDAIKYILTKKK